MDNVSSPANYVASLMDNLTDDVFGHAQRWPDHPGFSRQVAQGWVPVTYQETEQVTRLAAGLLASGVKPGDRVALFSPTSFEWMLCDFAIWTAGGVTVPVYETSSAEQVQWILADSGAVAAFVATGDLARIVAGLPVSPPELTEVWVLDSGALERLVASGLDISTETVMDRRRGITSASLATITYTSGTTGRPRGCAITHANLLAEIRNVCTARGVRELVFNEQTRTLHFLPMAHILARSIQLGAVHNRVHLAHTSDMKSIVPRLVEFRPTSVLSVPRVFERIYNTAQHRAASEGKERVFDLADATAMAYSQSLDTGGPGLLLRVRHAIFDHLVYSKIRATLGGQVRYSVSGGAPLGARLGHFFRGIGINVLEGYGLTEHVRV